MWNFKLSEGSFPALIGGQQSEGGEWAWSDGTQWGYENWAPGQPSVRSQAGNNYVVLKGNGCKEKWNDWIFNVTSVWHHNVLGFVCQYRRF